MFLKQNKLMLLGTLAVTAVFLGIHLMWVNENWAQAANKLSEADQAREAWEKNYKGGDNLMPKIDAEKVLEDNNRSLKNGLTMLQQIEFGTKETLQPFSEAAAGTGDHKNFLMSKRTTIYNHAKSLNVLCSAELGLTDKFADDPVAINLLRLAIIDSFFVSCNKAKIGRLLKIQHFPPKHLQIASEEAADDGDEKKSAKEKNEKETPEAPNAERLVQFPVKVLVLGSEPAINKLLFEVQKPTDRSQSRGYLCLRGFHITVRQAGSGTVEAVLGFSALLNEKLVSELGIRMKEDESRHGGSPKPKVDLDRY